MKGTKDRWTRRKPEEAQWETKGTEGKERNSRKPRLSLQFRGTLTAPGLFPIPPLDLSQKSRLTESAG